MEVSSSPKGGGGIPADSDFWMESRLGVGGSWPVEPAAQRCDLLERERESIVSKSVRLSVNPVSKSARSHRIEAR